MRLKRDLIQERIGLLIITIERDRVNRDLCVQRYLRQDLLWLLVRPTIRQQVDGLSVQIIQGKANSAQSVCRALSTEGIDPVNGTVHIVLVNLNHSIAPRCHATVERHQIEAGLWLELLGYEDAQLLLDKVQADLHGLGGVDEDADVVFGDGAEEFSWAFAQPVDALLVLFHGDVDALLVVAMQLGCDVDVNYGAVVPENVCELVAVAGVDKFLTWYLKLIVYIWLAMN